MLLEYYMSSDYRVSGGFDRWQSYGLRSTPTALFNGPQNKAIDWDSYEDYKSRIEEELAKDTSIAVEADLAVTGNGLTVSGKVLNNGPNTLEKAEVWVALYEDLGRSKLHYLVIDIERAGPLEELRTGESASFSESFSLSGSDLADVGAVVFVQSAESGRKVLQATST